MAAKRDWFTRGYFYSGTYYWPRRWEGYAVLISHVGLALASGIIVAGWAERVHPGTGWLALPAICAVYVNYVRVGARHSQGW